MRPAAHFELASENATTSRVLSLDGVVEGGELAAARERQQADARVAALRSSVTIASVPSVEASDATTISSCSCG